MSEYAWFKKKVGIIGWLNLEDEAHACMMHDGLLVAICGQRFVPSEMRSAGTYGMPCERCKREVQW